MSSLDDSTVRYSAKELFARIDQKLDVIANQLTAKADHEALVALETRVAALEQGQAEKRGFDKAKAAIIALSLAVLGLAIPVALHFIGG